MQNVNLWAKGEGGVINGHDVANASSSVSESLRDSVINNLLNNMVYVEGGTFMMSEKPHYLSVKNETPWHRVSLSSFSIGRYEVTQAEWEAVMENNPSFYKGSKRPVENVSWNLCQIFIYNLNKLTGRRFRLPTEADWEYAARGGSKSQGYKYSGGDNLDDVAWYKGNSGNTTHDVGGKLPNELGLYDMSGNVSEWCLDWYDRYSSAPCYNPVALDSTKNRLSRGGRFCYSDDDCLTVSRYRCFAKEKREFLGFRLVEMLRSEAEEREWADSAFEADIEEARKNPVIKNLVNNMVAVEGGTFIMGATDEQFTNATPLEKPAHSVTLSSFFIGRYEVTQEEWEAVMCCNPSWYRGAKKPVDNVLWQDCQDFIHRLNLITGKTFRLPTEAEWEYAARGGRKSKGYVYSGSNDLDEVGWCNRHIMRVEGSSHEVGGKKPNELGIYDMSGNVFEWCNDWLGSYSSSAQTNPAGPARGVLHVYRGGCWASWSWFSRVSNRFDYDNPDYYSNCIGFRIAL